MKIFGLTISLSSTLAALATAGMSELDKAIVAAKKTEIGAAAVAAVKAAEDPSLTSEQKLDQAMKAVVPVVVDYAAKGGLAALEADAEVFARQLIESTLADMKATKAVLIGRAILKASGVS